MSWSVDKPVQIGATTIAAIVEYKVSMHAVGTGLTGFAKKQPLLFVHIRDEQITGVDINGHDYEREEIETLYPDAIAQIHAKQPS